MSVSMWYVYIKCETHISAIISHACVHASHSHAHTRPLKSIYSMCMGTVFFSSIFFRCVWCLLLSFRNFLSYFTCIVNLMHQTQNSITNTLRLVCVCVYVYTLNAFVGVLVYRIITMTTTMKAATTNQISRE